MAVRSMRFRPHNIEDKDTWRTAIYVRLSDEDRDKKVKTDMSQSIENQISYIRSYVKMLNESSNEEYKVIIHDIYCDDDYTGMNFDRPEFMRMMKDVNRGSVDCIMVKNLSRLGRYDNKMQLYLEDVFEKQDEEVRFIAINDNYDSLYDEIDVLIKFRLLMNREYSETQRRNTMIGMRSMQENGKFIGAFAPYGYKKSEEDKHKLVPDSIAALVVKRIFKEYLEGYAPKVIARRLTDDGIVNPATYKRLNGSNYKNGKKISEGEEHWTGDSVKHILSDEVYTGVLVQHKRTKRKLTDTKQIKVPKEQQIRCENTHIAIISKEDWQQAQSMMKTVKRDVTKPDEITIFKGLLKCGDCHHAMRKRWDNYSSSKTGKVSKYLYYNCGTFRDYGSKGERNGEKVPKCTSHYISDKLLRSIIVNDINTIISQIRNLSDVVSKLQKSSKPKSNRVELEIEAKEKKIDIFKSRLKTAKGKWLDGLLDDEEYKETRDEIKKDIQHIEKEIDLLRNSVTNVSDVLNSQWVQKLLSMGKIIELDRATVVALVDKIYVYEDKHIEIIYKFSDEFDSLFAKVI